MQSVPGGAIYWDLGLTEGYARLSYFAQDDQGEREETVVHLPIPEDTMDELEALLGDGQATVTVGKDIKMSENYKTAGSSCFVKLTCNQDINTVLKTREIATTLALAFVEQGFEQSQYVLQRLCGIDVDPPPPLEIEHGKADPEPGRKQPPKKPATNKPSFRR